MSKDVIRSFLEDYLNSPASYYPDEVWRDISDIAIELTDLPSSLEELLNDENLMYDFSFLRGLVEENS